MTPTRRQELLAASRLGRLVSTGSELPPDAAPPPVHFAAPPEGRKGDLDPDGHWVTVSGNNIHITQDGEIDAGGHPALRKVLEEKAGIKVKGGGDRASRLASLHPEIRELGREIFNSPPVEPRDMKPGDLLYVFSTGDRHGVYRVETVADGGRRVTARPADGSRAVRLKPGDPGTFTDREYYRRVTPEQAARHADLERQVNGEPTPDPQRVAALRKAIQKKAHTVADVIGGRFPVGTESGGGRDRRAAERAGLYVGELAGLTVYARSKADTFPLAAYLEGGGRYGTPEFSRLLGYTPDEVREYEDYLRADGQLDLLGHDAARAYTPPPPPPAPHELTRAEYAARVAAAPTGKFSTSETVDWGSGLAQGKRVGGMVRGAMADPPRGKKTYHHLLGALPREETRDLEIMTEAARVAYARTRAAGFDHAHSLDAAMEADGPGIDAHKFAVRDALAAGRRVSRRVAADYPDLAAAHPDLLTG